MSFMLFHHPEQADEHAQHDHNYSRCSDELSTALFHRYLKSVSRT